MGYPECVHFLENLPDVKMCSWQILLNSLSIFKNHLEKEIQGFQLWIKVTLL